MTEGCPLCIVERAFHSEPHMRLLSLACRIYKFLGKTMLSCIAASLPSFDFLYGAFVIAVKKDPFWGPEYWDVADDKAAKMELGVTQMVAQALGHQARLQESGSGQEKDKKVLKNWESTETENDRSEGRMPKLPSPLAKKQLEMGKEEREHLAKLAAEKGIAAFSGNSQDGFRFHHRRHHRRRARVPTIINHASLWETMAVLPPPQHHRQPVLCRCHAMISTEQDKDFNETRPLICCDGVLFLAPVEPDRSVPAPESSEPDKTL